MFKLSKEIQEIYKDPVKLGIKKRLWYELFSDKCLDEEKRKKFSKIVDNICSFGFTLEPKDIELATQDKLCFPKL